MFHVRPIAQDAVPRALQRAERYRLLNEPRQAESICLDVLAAAPGNQPALVCLILARTDMFADDEARADEVRPLLDGLTDAFERRYYAGVIEERWGKHLLSSGYPPEVAYGFVRQAMHHFEAAEPLAPDANDDAVLRWNTCVRMIEQYALGEAAPHDDADESFDDDVPQR